MIRRQLGFLAVAFCMLFVARGALAEGLMSRVDLDAKVREAVADLYKHSSAARELAGKSHGMLVFPSIIKGGIGIGGEYGEGALLVGGRTADYYNIASASVGFQLGGQKRSVVILFMTPDAFQKFRASSGWKAGVDGSVAIATLGTGGALDTETLKKPIIGFVFENKGLMYNLTLEGSKITKIKKSK
jgi:lipid-binding SYLF domain-containing protein